MIKTVSPEKIVLLGCWLGCCGALLSGQAPPANLGFTSKLLMEVPLGDLSDPEMSLFVLTLAPGASAPAHSHAGAVFAYVLEGDIENQVEPEAPQMFHPGGFFHERPMQMHRIFRNLSQTEAAKILILQNTSTLPAGVKPLLQETLENTRNQEVRVVSIVATPGFDLKGAHEHPGPVFAYLVRGQVQSQVDPDPPKTYRAGEVFYEPPLHAHRMYRNLSATEPAELLNFQVGEIGKPPVMILGK